MFRKFLAHLEHNVHSCGIQIHLLSQILNKVYNLTSCYDETDNQINVAQGVYFGSCLVCPASASVVVVGIPSVLASLLLRWYRNVRSYGIWYVVYGIPYLRIFTPAMVSSNRRNFRVYGYHARTHGCTHGGFWSYCTVIRKPPIKWIVRR